MSSRGGSTRSSQWPVEGHLGAYVCSHPHVLIMPTHHTNKCARSTYTKKALNIQQKNNIIIICVEIRKNKAQKRIIIDIDAARSWIIVDGREKGEAGVQ